MRIVFEHSRMYKNFKSWNPQVGCYHRCKYCEVSFQRQAKRLKGIEFWKYSLIIDFKEVDLNE